jgi:radical SAM enzyme (TIGR01210 family)
VIASYPENARDQDHWILLHRGPRNPVDPTRPHAFFLEQERAESGEMVSVATVFLTNRECPWRCLMCDLWKNTLTETLAPGAIPVQIDYALANLGPARQIKLYNSGSFFDPRAIPPEDHPAIADQLRAFERVIVECHPALVKEPVRRFRALLGGELEVAMGLETAHSQVMARLNKRMTLDQFAGAAEFLRTNGITLRVFVLVKPPFLDETAALDWAKRSIDFAFDCGAGVVSLIPTRLGNGALEALAVTGDFSPPRLTTLEAAADYGVQLQRGRVFADLWDLEKFSTCPTCLPARRNRLERMNHTQQIQPRIECPCCIR